MSPARGPPTDWGNGLPSLSPRWTEVERIFTADGIRIVAKNDQESADQSSGLKAADTALK